MGLRVNVNKGTTRRLQNIGTGLGEAFSMSDPALLRALGTVHREQEVTIFSTEGAAGGRAKWDPLNARYALRKKKVVSSRKILVLTGATRDAFVKATDPDYIEQYVATSETLGVFQFGATSDVAAAHLYGSPSLAPAKSATARLIFGGKAKRLPVRDMITKSAAQIDQMREALRDFFIKRVRQLARARGALRSA